MQSAVLPYALAGHDVIACAETGTGKTGAFVLPILQQLLKDADAAGGTLTPGTRALVLAPTRELAVQIEDTVQGLLVPHDRHQLRRLRRRADGAAGARAPGRRPSGGGDAGPADGSHALGRAQLQEPGSPGPRRGRSDDGHGLLARRPAHRQRAAGDAADAAVLGDDARRDAGADAVDRARRRSTSSWGAPAGPRAPSRTRWSRSRPRTSRSGSRGS